MNQQVSENYAKIRWWILLFPLAVLLAIGIFLVFNNALEEERYVLIQKDVFYTLNGKLSQFPVWQNNLTQLGDALVAFSMLSVLLYYAPKLWQVLLSASLLSLFFSKLFKTIFDVPRPATIYDNETFAIIGRTLVGYSSFPSGHSITIFTTITVVMLAFLPKSKVNKILWIGLMLIFGLVSAFTRVGVGAHHPLDVVVGSCIGFITGVLGILINRKLKIWDWVGKVRFYPFFILVFLGGIVALGIKIWKEPLLIFFLTIIGLCYSLYLLVRAYREERMKKN